MAFFLKAGFIGVMLFDIDRVSRRVHLLSCVMVALGAVVSAFWILAANSWMQTPAGFSLDAGRLQLASWWEAIFTPSFPHRLAHMVVAAYIAGSFVVIGVCGFYLWRRQYLEFARAGYSVALWMAIVLVPLQLIIGDLHGRNTLAYQPIKVAAMVRPTKSHLRSASDRKRGKAACRLPSAVASSLVLFVTVYTVLLLAFFFYAMRIVFRGPRAPEAAEEPYVIRPGVDAAPARAPAE